MPKTEDKNAFNVEENATESVKDRETPGRTMNSLPQQGLVRMETIMRGGEWLKHFMKVGRALQDIA